MRSLLFLNLKLFTLGPNTLILVPVFFLAGLCVFAFVSCMVRYTLVGKLLGHFEQM